MTPRIRAVLQSECNILQQAGNHLSHIHVHTIVIVVIELYERSYKSLVLTVKGLDSRRLILAGWGQGGAMAVHTGLEFHPLSLSLSYVAQMAKWSVMD
jgi:hypothetical protein